MPASGATTLELTQGSRVLVRMRRPKVLPSVRLRPARRTESRPAPARAALAGAGHARRDPHGHDPVPGLSQAGLPNAGGRHHDRQLQRADRDVRPRPAHSCPDPDQRWVLHRDRDLGCCQTPARLSEARDTARADGGAVPGASARTEAHSRAGPTLLVGPLGGPRARGQAQEPPFGPADTRPAGLAGLRAGTSGSSKRSNHDHRQSPPI